MGENIMNDYKVIKFEGVKGITSKEYFSADEYASDMFDAKYCNVLGESRHEDTGITEKLIETPAEVFYRVASGLAEVETTDEKKEYYRDMWFSLMWDGWFRPGGSVLSGVGSSKTKSLFNCTTLPLYEDTLESLAETRYWLTKVAAFRQGVGFDASALRPRGTHVNNAAEESTGSIPWIDDLVNIGSKVGQKGRKPALLVSLKVSHPDVFEFISCKDDITQINDANISVQITDDFMDAVLSDSDWTTSFTIESTGETIKKTVKAKELFKLIAEHAWKSAEPGVQYIDLMKKGSMVQCISDVNNDPKYNIISTNACSEKSLAAFSVCNLLSINKEKFSTDSIIYAKQLAFLAPFIVRMSDNVSTYELTNKLSPLPQQADMIENLREIGCGITNIHSWLLNQDVAYDSDEAIERVGHFMKVYACEVFKASIELGKELGNAKAFDLVKDKKAYMESSYFKNVVDEIFDGDYTKVTHMRNMAHMSIAPTGSLSSTFSNPCLSSGIEPVIAPYYWRMTRAIAKGEDIYYFVIPKGVKDYILTKLDKDSDEYKLLDNFTGSELDNDGKIGIPLKAIIDENIGDFIKPAHLIDPIQKVRLMGEVYKFIDSAVSVTYNMSKDTTPEDVEEIYMEAYKAGVRAVSVYRDGCRPGVLIFEDPITNAKKFEDGSNSICVGTRPKSIVPNCAPKRPKSLKCDIHHTSIKGEVWTVLVGLMDGLPYEIFCGNSEDIYLPKSCKEGTITKAKSGTYSLEVMIRNSPVEYKQLASVLMNDEQKALTRILSLNLRHGVLPQFMVSQLKKTGGDIVDFSTAISRVLSKYVKDYVFKDGENSCPNCGNDSLVYMENCMKCAEPSCGYSRCS
jgi:ribonucleoside-diphosphate reductase alpha chain